MLDVRDRFLRPMAWAVRSSYNGVEQIDRDGKKRGRVVFAGNFAHGLQETQLQRNRLLAHHRGGLHHFFRGLKFAFGVDDLGAAFALGFGLLGHRALHRVGQRHVLDLDRRDFDAPRFGLPVDDLLQLLVDRLALRKQVVQGAWPSTLRSVVCAMSEVALRKFSTFTTAACGSTTRK